MIKLSHPKKMREQYIDTRNLEEAYRKSATRLLEDEAVSKRNKELIMKFLRDAALGKTVIGRAKKKIGKSRLNGYLHHFRHLLRSVRKDLDVLDMDDMEEFIASLEDNQLRSQRPLWSRAGYKRENTPISPRYAVDIKITVKKFYKWLMGNNKTYPTLVEWIDTHCTPKEIPALTEAEVQRMADRAQNQLHRALTQVLFDSGLRISEVLNVRLRHVRLLAPSQEYPDRKCFVIRAPFSKTLPRTVVCPMNETTRWLSLWLEDHPANPRVLSDGTFDADDTEAQLFPLRDSAARTVIRRLGERALGKRVYPHLLRHTSATYWCNKLPYFKFCKRFGWTMTSNMPQRYIDRAGVDEFEIADIYFGAEAKNATHASGADLTDRETEHQEVGPNSSTSEFAMPFTPTKRQPRNPAPRRE